MRIAVAVAALAAVVVLLLVPFHPEAFLLNAAWSVTAPSDHVLVWDAVEWGGNVTMFAAVTAITWLLARRVRLAVAVGIALSVLAELTQLMIPQRVASMTDVLLNSVGCLAAGALIALVRHLRAHRSAVGEHVDRPPSVQGA